MDPFLFPVLAGREAPRAARSPRGRACGSSPSGVSRARIAPIRLVLRVLKRLRPSASAGVAPDWTSCFSQDWHHLGELPVDVDDGFLFQGFSPEFSCPLCLSLQHVVLRDRCISLDGRLHGSLPAFDIADPWAYGAHGIPYRFPFSFRCRKPLTPQCFPVSSEWAGATKCVHLWKY